MTSGGLFPTSLLLGSLLLGLIAPTAQAARVVLDPGHGGSNLGTKAPDGGPYEKQVTLALATKVAARLAAAGIEVLLTREGDRAESLPARVAFANAAGADLFVSIHANASSAHDRHGFELYVASPLATDALAPAGAWYDEGDGPSGDRTPVAAILGDLARGAAQDLAAVAARAMERSLSLADPSPDADRGTKEAAFDVLAGPRMPALLVEVGFLDAQPDARRLTSEAGQAALADALAAGIFGALQQTLPGASAASTREASQAIARKETSRPAQRSRHGQLHERLISRRE